MARSARRGYSRQAQPNATKCNTHYENGVAELRNPDFRPIFAFWLCSRGHSSVSCFKVGPQGSSRQAQPNATKCNTHYENGVAEWPYTAFRPSFAFGFVRWKMQAH
jgi:hypothetical protein